MKGNKYRLMISLLTAVAFLSACAPQAEPAPTVDVVGTIAAELASTMLTQTAAAYSPTPLPPTLTPIPEETETPIPEPVATSIPQVNRESPCYTGPGPNYPLTSYISDTKQVELIGVGSVPGWYVIENPYFYSPCWINAENLNLGGDFDLSAYPTITP